MVTKAVFAEAFDKTHEIKSIPISMIRSNPYQPRKTFDSDHLQELANSITEFGVMQPVSVRKSGDKYELIAGERRLRASKIAGNATIPAIVVQVSERDSAFIALMENLQRENLNFLEEAEGYANLIEDYGLTQDEVAKRLGKSQSNVANKIRVLKLPNEVKDKVRTHNLTERHARALLRLSDKGIQLKAIQKIVAEGMNVKNTEAYIERLLQGAPPKKSRKKGKPKFYIRDTRIYTNTIKKAVELIQQSGGDADFDISESDDSVEVLVIIKKKKQ